MLKFHLNQSKLEYSLMMNSLDETLMFVSFSGTRSYFGHHAEFCPRLIVIIALCMADSIPGIPSSNLDNEH